MSGNEEQAPTPARRRALKWLAGLCGTVAATFAGVPALRAFLFPVFRPAEEKRWFKLGETGGFDVGVPTKVDFPEVAADAWVENRLLRTVWVYADDAAHFRAYNGRCTHLGCAYRFDRLPDPQYHRAPNVFHCPCHHGIYDPRTGAVLSGPPPRPLDTLATKIEGGALFVAYEDFRVGIRQKVAV